MLLSEKYPYAVHVAPLHAIPHILEHGLLLSRDRRLEAGVDISRPTSAEVDNALGLSEFVHFYLCDRSRNWSSLTDKIARTSLLTKMLGKTPFPHVALEFQTKDLEVDNEYLVSAWNVAKGGRGGRAAPKTAEAKAEYWAKEMVSWSWDYAALKGQSLSGYGIPLMTREVIELPQNERPAGFSKAFDDAKELLISGSVDVNLCLRARVYSPEDLEHFSGMSVGKKPPVLGTIPGYNPKLVAQEVRAAIREAFASPKSPPPALNFD